MNRFIGLLTIYALIELIAENFLDTFYSDEDYNCKHYPAAPEAAPFGYDG
jgi:hypothetical protein